jgi:small subunit ribosomal protein S6
MSLSFAKIDLMRLYELVLVLRTSLTDEKRKKFLDKVKEWLKDAKVTQEDVWGQKPLAYKIKKELAGFYHILHLESEHGITKEFEKLLIADENVLRHLLIRKK